MKRATILLLSLVVAASLAACADSRPRSNPLDPKATDDAYELAVTWGGEAIRVSWKRLDIDGLAGYWVYRKMMAAGGEEESRAFFVEQPKSGAGVVFDDTLDFAGDAAFVYQVRAQGVGGWADPSAEVAFAPDTDLDGDGAIADDCMANLAAVHPGAAEACNGRDDDCDGAVDEAGDCGLTCLDADEDGYGEGAGCKGADCDDGRPETWADCDADPCGSGGVCGAGLVCHLGLCLSACNINADCPGSQRCHVLPGEPRGMGACTAAAEVTCGACATDQACVGASPEEAVCCHDIDLDGRWGATCSHGSDCDDGDGGVWSHCGEPCTTGAACAGGQCVLSEPALGSGRCGGEPECDCPSDTFCDPYAEEPTCFVDQPCSDDGACALKKGAGWVCQAVADGASLSRCACLEPEDCFR